MVQCGAVWCSVVQYGVRVSVCCSELQCGVVQCSVFAVES